MAVSFLSAPELREKLADPDFVTTNGFLTMRSLCALHGTEIDDQDFHDLILRTLEHRERLGPHKEILNALVREVGLFPYLDPEELGFADRIAYEFHRPANMADNSIVFHRPQARVYRDLINGRSVILSAPTSFGKSLIIDAVVASGKFRNILVIVPTIALIDETRRRLSSFQPVYKVITHTSQHPAPRNIYVFTQERALEQLDLDSINFFVIDEFYKLSPSRDNENRFSLLNQIFYKLARKGKQFYMLGPSIIGIPEDMRSRLECSFYHEPYNTVVSEVHRVQGEGNEFDRLARLCKGLTGPTIIFCQSPARAANVANKLIERGVGETRTEVTHAVDWIGREYHPNWHFTRALSQGIGVHHGRIPRALAQYVVRAFDSDKIKYLICTSTLIEGVNTKAENIVIFDNKINRQMYDYFTFNNIKGRSGRMFKHFVGHVYLFHDPPQEGLPFVDVPAFTQSNEAPESLLIQLEEDDLTGRSRERLGPYHEQTLLYYETLRANIGVDLEAQLQVARAISRDIDGYNRVLRWNRIPSYDQLLAICRLIWQSFGGQRFAPGSITSAAQLTLKLKSLEALPSIAEMIRVELGYTHDPEKAVPKVLDFLRLWASFHFPRLLRAIEVIQRDIFTRHGLSAGNYEFYASKVENLFLDPAITALDEYGIPIQLGMKLESYLSPNGDLDVALQNLARLDISTLDLAPFERELLRDAQSSFSK